MPRFFSCYLKLDGVQDSSEIIKKTKASIFIIFYLANISYNILHNEMVFVITTMKVISKQLIITNTFAHPKYFCEC